MNKDDLHILNELVKTSGLPGREVHVSTKILEFLPNEGWQKNIDVLGNLTISKKGSGRKVLIIAHMDEVGLIVRRITPEGFLLVERMGGFNLTAASGGALDLWSSKGHLDAHIGAYPAHLHLKNNKLPDVQELFVDIGSRSREEAISRGVRVGDGLTWRCDFSLLENERIRSKALDDRLGCYVLIKLAHRLQKINVDEEIQLAFVTQEELGILEAAPIINTYDPDIVIGIDGTLAFDTPDFLDPQCDIRLGKGPCIKLMDAIRGKTAYLPDWVLTSRIVDYMERNSIPFQPEVIVGLSTAVSLVPFMKNGIQSACFSLPIRYHHSAVETADMSDVDALIETLSGLISDRIFSEVVNE